MENQSSHNDQINELLIQIKELQAENERLSYSEKRYKELIESTSDWIWETDINGKYTYCSPNIKNILGYETEEVLKMNPMDLFVDDYKEELYNYLIDKRNNLEKIKDAENWNVKKDGSLVCLLTNGFPFFDNNGNLLGYRGVDKDITEKKRIEELLNESNDRFQSAFKTSPYVMIITDPSTGLIIEANDEFFDLTQYNRDEIENDTTISLGLWVYEKDREFVVNELINGRKIIRKEYHFKKKNGELIVGLFSAQILQIKGKISILSSIEDITDQINTEQALRLSEKRLLEAQKLLKIGNWEYTISNQIIDCSEQVYSIFEIENLNTKFNYQDFINLIHPEDKDFVEKSFNDTITKNIPCNIIHKIITNNFEIKYVKENAITFYDENNNPIKMIGTIQDVTQETLSEIELQTAIIKAEESDRLKSAFLQNISHEIRTPLNGIIGFSNLLQDDNITLRDISDYTLMIKNSSLRLLEIINNLLDISKIETGQVIINNKPFNVCNLLKEIFTLHKSKAEKKHLKLIQNNLSINDKDFILDSDENKISQIFNNLFSNSLKFTNSGFIEFGYETHLNNVTFYVKDSGIGIPKELSHRIFVRFAQVNIDITRGYEGAGLGLSICKGLVELLGGKIWFDSEHERGSTFYFQIPIKSVPNFEKSDNTELINKHTQTNLKILVVEDDEISWQYIRKILKRRNYSILYADNGIDAVQFVKNISDIDIVLMDIRLPQLDGMKATQEIKKIRPELPIIAQTAYAYSQEKEKFLALGCNDYVAKPMQPEEIYLLIEKYT